MFAYSRTCYKAHQQAETFKGALTITLVSTFKVLYLSQLLSLNDFIIGDLASHLHRLEDIALILHGEDVALPGTHNLPIIPKHLGDKKCPLSGSDR